MKEPEEGKAEAKTENSQEPQERRRNMAKDVAKQVRKTRASPNVLTRFCLDLFAGQQNVAKLLSRALFKNWFYSVCVAYV